MYPPCTPIVNNKTKFVTVKLYRMAPCRRPRVFVYPLPAGYQDSSETAGASPVAEAAGLLPGWPSGVDLHASQAHGLGSLFYQRALQQQHRCGTTPDAADLFLVPAFRSALTPRPSLSCMESPDNASQRGGHETALYQRIREVTLSNGQPALDARGGADHVLLLPRIGASYETRPSCELDYFDPRLGLATRLSLGEPIEQWDNDYRTVDGFHSVPYPSLVHLDRRATALPWASTHSRGVLAALAVELHGSRQSLALRQKLHNLCVNDYRRCRMFRPRKEAAIVPVGGLASLYWNATFCLQPRYAAPAPDTRPLTSRMRPYALGATSLMRPYALGATSLMRPYVLGSGDSVTRKAVVDALLLGCIPVLFHPGQAVQWPWHWAAWNRNATVMLSADSVIAGRLNPLEVLEAFPPSEISAMRGIIAREAHAMHYAATDSSALDHLLPAPHDAFDLALRGAWARARESSPAELRAARAEAAATEQAVDEFLREQAVGYCTAMRRWANCERICRKASLPMRAHRTTKAAPMPPDPLPPAMLRQSDWQAAWLLATRSRPTQHGRVCRALRELPQL